jgi:hypothetical protein
MTKKQRTYNQFDVDNMYNYMLNGESIKDWYDDCQRIKAVIKVNRNIQLSSPAAFKFWSTRSGWWDASWLAMQAGEKGEAEILEYWDKFINDWHKDEVVDEEENQ